MIGDEPTVLRDALEAALGVRRVTDEVAAGAPYADPDALIAVLRAAMPLSDAELDEALSHHPRIGETPHGEGAAQAFSRREQASADAGDAELAARIAAGNHAYEERFGRVFLIRAKGRTRAEIAAALERRLELDDATERRIVAEQLLEIATLRLSSSFGEDAA